LYTLEITRQFLRGDIAEAPKVGGDMSLQWLCPRVKQLTSGSYIKPITDYTKFSEITKCCKFLLRN